MSKYIPKSTPGQIVIDGAEGEPEWAKEIIEQHRKEKAKAWTKDFVEAFEKELALDVLFPKDETE